MELSVALSAMSNAVIVIIIIIIVINQRHSKMPAIDFAKATPHKNAKIKKGQVHHKISKLNFMVHAKLSIMRVGIIYEVIW